MLSRLLLVVFTLCLTLNISAQKKLFTVFQLNIWHEGTVVPKGYDAIINEIIDKNADVVMLCEVNNQHGVDFVSRLLHDLKAKGQHYYGRSSEQSVDVATLSKYPILAQHTLYEKENRQGSGLKNENRNLQPSPSFLFCALGLYQLCLLSPARI